MSMTADRFPIDQPADLGVVLTKVLARRWWVVGSMLLFATAFAIIAFSTAPVYRSSVVLAPTSEERGMEAQSFTMSPLGGLASSLGLGPGDAQTEEALAVLRSREFTQDFISSQNLLPQLFHDEWNPATATWKADVKHPPTLYKGYKYFNTKIRTVIEDHKTGLITLQIDWTDRNEAAAWANALVEQLNGEMRARAIAQAEASTAFLNKELKTTTTMEGRDAISRLLEAQLKQRMIANVTHDYSFRVVDKALPADSDDRVKPHKGMLIMMGALLGLIVATISILVLDSLRTAGISRARSARIDDYGKSWA